MGLSPSLGCVLVLLIAVAFPAAAGSPESDALTPKLRERVERLKIEAATPTDDRQLLLQRLETPWDWTNVAALAGVVIPVDLPYFVPGVRNILLGLDDTPVTTAQISELIARFTRELQIKDEMPDAIGSLTLSDPGPFVVGQTVTLSETYTGGSDAVLGRARQLHERGEHQLAMELVDVVLEVEPDHREAHLLKAACCDALVETSTSLNWRGFYRAGAALERHAAGEPLPETGYEMVPVNR